MNSTAVLRTTSDLQGSGVRAWVLWVGLAIAWFAATQLYPLIEPDEARYAEIPREMAASGDWLTPRLDGLKYFEKPPLQYWATALLYEAFGVSEWTARAWPLALSFLCLPLVFASARRLYGARAAAASLAVLGMSPLFVILGHLNILDGAFTFWLTAALLAFTVAQTAAPRSRSERNWMLLAWLAAALAVMSKGIVVPVLLGGTLVAYSIVQRDVGVWRRLHFGLGIPLFLVVAAPWFIAVSVQNPEFPKFFFLHEHFARFLTTVHKRTEPWWYFLPFVALALLSWIAHLRGAFLRAWQDTRAPEVFQPLRFLSIYAAVVLVFFSVSQSKLPPYIFPMLPALAVVLGVHVADRSESLRQAGWIAAAAVTAFAAGLAVYVLRRYDAPALQPLAWAAIAVVFATVGACGVKLHRSMLRNAAVLAAASILAWQCLLVAYVAPPSARSAVRLVRAVQPNVHERTMLYTIGQYRQSVPFYLARTLTVVDYSGELEFGLQQEPGRNSATLAEFRKRWQSHTDAVAFFKPDSWTAMQREGLPGRVIAADRNSTAVSRR